VDRARNVLGAQEGSASLCANVRGPLGVWYNFGPMRNLPFVLICSFVALVTGFSCQAVRAENKQQSACSSPPEFVSRRPLPKEEQEKAKKVKPQGSVAIVINEGGEVIDAKVTRTTSEQSSKLMIELAKGMVFKPRPTCGPVKTVVNFNQGK